MLYLMRRTTEATTTTTWRINRRHKHGYSCRAHQYWLVHVEHSAGESFLERDPNPDLRRLFVATVNIRDIERCANKPTNFQIPLARKKKNLSPGANCPLFREHHYNLPARGSDWSCERDVICKGEGMAVDPTNKTRLPPAVVVSGSVVACMRAPH